MRLAALLLAGLLAGCGARLPSDPLREARAHVAVLDAEVARSQALADSRREAFGKAAADSPEGSEARDSYRAALKDLADVLARRDAAKAYELALAAQEPK